MQKTIVAGTLNGLTYRYFTEIILIGEWDMKCALKLLKSEGQDLT
jgi:hypothetical protein